MAYDGTESGGDAYSEYVRQRSLNRVLCRSIVWSTIWMLMGCGVLLTSFLLAPRAPLHGVDPIGRSWDLSPLLKKSNEVKK